MDELIEFLENFDFAYDVRADYESLREEMGLTATIRRLREEYSEPLEDHDDSQIFWLALACAMAQNDELNEEVLRRAMKCLRSDALRDYAGALRTFSEADVLSIEESMKPHIHPPKRRKIKRYKKYVTDWKPGDVYAMEIKSELAREKNMYGKYFLFRMIYGQEFDGDIIPVVYVSYTPDTSLPTNMEQLQKCPFIIVKLPHKKPLYRRMIGDRKCLDCDDFRNLKYIGNFPDYAPEIEWIPQNPIYNSYEAWDTVSELLLKLSF